MNAIERHRREQAIQQRIMEYERAVERAKMEARRNATRQMLDRDATRFLFA